MPKTIRSEILSSQIELLPISDALWKRLATRIPVTLSADADARLRASILACCSWLLTQQRQLQVGQETAAAMRRRGKGQLAPFERLVKGLRLAADAWQEIERIHDDRLSDLSRFDELEALARDAERRLAGFRLAELKLTERPWREFVRKVASCFRKENIVPARTGRTYEPDTKLGWFQAFMLALQAELLGRFGKISNSPAAFAAEIAKALRGDTKPGKSRK